MKKTLSAFCVMVAMPCIFGTMAAHATTVPDEPAPDSSAQASSLPGWTINTGSTHVPLNGVPVGSSATNEHKFRYMDMASVKPAKGLRRAVIVYGSGKSRNSCSASGRSAMPDDMPQIRRPSQHNRPAVVMRPMT